MYTQIYMPEDQTIRVDRDTARKLKKMGPTQGEAVKRLVEQFKRETRQINFRREVDPTTGITIQEDAPIDGIITGVTAHFPPGANSLVGVKVSKENTQIVPQTGEVRLDDATPVWDCWEAVEKGKTISTIINNYDSANSHKISVIVTIIGRP